MNLVKGREVYLTLRMSAPTQVLGQPRETVLLAIPASLYVMQNNLLILALTNLDAATYQVPGQLAVILPRPPPQGDLPDEDPHHRRLLRVAPGPAPRAEVASCESPRLATIVTLLLVILLKGRLDFYKLGFCFTVF